MVNWWSVLHWVWYSLTLLCKGTWIGLILAYAVLLARAIKRRIWLEL